MHYPSIQSCRKRAPHKPPAQINEIICARLQSAGCLRYEQLWMTADFFVDLILTEVAKGSRGLR